MMLQYIFLGRPVRGYMDTLLLGVCILGTGTSGLPISHVGSFIPRWTVVQGHSVQPGTLLGALWFIPPILPRP